MIDSLWQALIDDPDDVARWLVLGDALQAMNDPRGRLIAMQVARETDPGATLATAERRWLFEHRTALLGPLRCRGEPWHVDWHRGFFETLELTVDTMTKTTATLLTELSGNRALAPLRHLRLVSAAHFDRAALAILRQPWPLLRSLRLGPMNAGAGRIDVPLQRLLNHLPELRWLRVQFPAELSNLLHDRLKRLEIAAHGTQFGELDLGGMPNLQRLEIAPREPIPSGGLAGLCDVTLDELHLHAGAIDAWLISEAPPPRRLVLWGANEGQAMNARARGCEVIEAAPHDASRDRLLTSPRHRLVRRFTRGERFWQLDRRGNVVRLRYGKAGRNGTGREVRHRSAYEASRDYHKRLCEKLAAGFEETFVPDAKL